MRSSTDVMPIISKLYCSSSAVVLLVRKRPVVVNGGGFVVTDGSNRVLFVVDGCGKLGAKGALMVKDGTEAESIMYIHKQGGVVKALSTRNKWTGYSTDYQGQNKLVFSITDQKSCFASKTVVRISIEPKKKSNASWDFEMNGSFVDKAFTLIDHNRRVIAKRNGLAGADWYQYWYTFPTSQVEAGEMIGSKDLYQVWIQSGYDQAFVIGVIAVLDNIFGESTSCQ